MNVYETADIGTLLKNNPYPGRGILIGTAPGGEYAVCAYFIMGRSENSRNREFRLEGETLRTVPHDPARVEDPALIIYRAVQRVGHDLVVTNGDQTDTICDGLVAGKTFSQALAARCFEPDAPHFTPRISGILHFGTPFSYEMSILKSADAAGSACARYTFSFPAVAGVGHFLHTYMGNGTPLPTFTGEPVRVALSDDSASFAATLWESLNGENRIALYVRYTSLSDGSYTDRIYQRHIPENG